MPASTSTELVDKPTEVDPGTGEAQVCIIPSELHALSGSDALRICDAIGVNARVLNPDHDLTPSEFAPGVPDVILLLETGVYFQQRVEQLRKLRLTPTSVTGVLVALHRNEATSWDYATGFDDFILRPYLGVELLARLRMLLWRKNKAKEGIVTAGRMTLDIGAHRATVDGDEIALTAKEFAILVRLVTNMGTLVTREHIMFESWRELSKVNPRMLDAHVSHLRHKLRDAVHLKTIRGKGYKLDVHPTVVSARAVASVPPLALASSDRE